MRDKQPQMVKVSNKIDWPDFLAQGGREMGQAAGGGGFGAALGGTLGGALGLSARDLVNAKIKHEEKKASALAGGLAGLGGGIGAGALLSKTAAGGALEAYLKKKGFPPQVIETLLSIGPKAAAAGLGAAGGAGAGYLAGGDD